MKKKLLLTTFLISLLGNKHNTRRSKKNPRLHKKYEYFEKSDDINSLILSGGGLACYNYLNFFDELEKKYNIENFLINNNDIITCNSAGSVFTLGIILGYTIKELKIILDEIAIKVFKKRNIQIEGLFKIFTSNSLLSTDVFREILERTIKESPLNKLLRGDEINNKSYKLHINKLVDIDQVTPDNLTIDLLTNLFPLKIFNFVTFNQTKNSIEVFTSYEYINDELDSESGSNELNNKFLNDIIKKNPEFKNIFYSEWSSIRYKNCIFKNSKAKIVDIVLASASIPFVFKPIKIDSECFGKESNDLYYDGFIGGSNIPVLINNLILKILNSRSLNNFSNIYNNMILHTDIVKEGSQKDNNEKRGYNIIIELFENLISNSSVDYTKALSYDNKICNTFGYYMNNRYFNIKYTNSALIYNNFLKNKKIYQESKNYFKYLFDFKFDDDYIKLQSDDYYRYINNKDWIQKFLDKRFFYEKIKNETIFNYEASDRKLVFDNELKKQIIKEYLKKDIK